MDNSGMRRVVMFDRSKDIQGKELVGMIHPTRLGAWGGGPVDGGPLSVHRSDPVGELTAAAEMLRWELARLVVVKDLQGGYRMLVPLL